MMMGCNEVLIDCVISGHDVMHCRVCKNSHRVVSNWSGMMLKVDAQ